MAESEPIQIKAEFDLDQYGAIAKKFLNQAKRHGKEFATKVVDHQQKIAIITRKVQFGQISASSGKRAVRNYQRAIKSYMETMEKAIKWEQANAYWEATGSLLGWLGTLASVLVKAL